MRGILPEFHLGEDQIVSPPGNEVDLTHAAAKISLHNPVSPLRQVLRCKAFSQRSQFRTVRAFAHTVSLLSVLRLPPAVLRSQIRGKSRRSLQRIRTGANPTASALTSLNSVQPIQPLYASGIPRP